MRVTEVLRVAGPKYFGVGAKLVWERARSRLQTGPLWWWRFVGPTPERLLFSPSNLRPSDPLVARDIYQGRFTFSGRTVEAGSGSVFQISSPSPAWSVDLHRFRWLRHLQHAGTELATENGRALVDDWILVEGRRTRGVPWQPDVCADRVIAWLQHSRFLLQNSEHGFYRRFMAALARHIRYLRGVAPGCSDDFELLKVRLALALSSLTLPSGNGIQRRAASNLEDQLRRQILSDGGHISRGPDIPAELLADLLPLSQVYVAASRPVPSEVQSAIDRIFPMLRFFRHADGSIAQFNGAGFGGSELASAVLRHDSTNSGAMDVASQSGYHRLTAGNCVVIADIGPSARGSHSKHAHGGTLAFELSAGRSRIVVNAGVDRLKRETYEAPARATAAHSTLVLDDAPSTKFATFGSRNFRTFRVVSGPMSVLTQPWSTEKGNGFSARHDGYVRLAGLWHERGILLSADGTRIDGYDRLTPESTAHEGEHKADIRFHLHPTVTVKSLEDGSTLDLRADSGEVWRFTVVGVVPKVEESIYLAGVTGPVYNQQIVLSFTYPDRDSVTWRFSRLPQ